MRISVPWGQKAGLPAAAAACFIPPMGELRECWRRTVRRIGRRWEPVFQHARPLPGVAGLDRLTRLRLDVTVLLIGLRRPAAWRAGLLLALALLLVELLRGYWSLQGPAWQLAQCLLALDVLPALARTRRAALRLLLRHPARSGGGGPRHGVL